MYSESLTNTYWVSAEWYTQHSVLSVVYEEPCLFPRIPLYGRYYHVCLTLITSSFEAHAGHIFYLLYFPDALPHCPPPNSPRTGLQVLLSQGCHLPGMSVSLVLSHSTRLPVLDFLIFSDSPGHQVHQAISPGTASPLICKPYLLPSCARVLSHLSLIWLFATLWTVAPPALRSLGFSRQEYGSGLPCPPPGDLSDPGI